MILQDDDHVTVAGHRLARRRGPVDPRVPDSAAFERYVIDASTAALLEHIAGAVSLREPCLLEGPTGASKSSAVLYLASLLRQPVVRVELHGHADAGELVGRFVPREEGGGFRWSDGALPLAMRHGWWVLLDEINLAEPQVLERLNAALDPCPSLALSEFDHRVIGGPDDPVHPDFRIFGTMNPATYAGRASMSPAFLARWTAHRACPAPTDRDCELMIRQLLAPRPYEVEIDGSKWTIDEGDSRLEGLGGAAWLSARIPALARFHASVEAASTAVGAGAIGSDRRDPYAYTRRTLLALLRFVDLREQQGRGGMTALQHGLRKYYLAKLATNQDRDTLARLALAHGLLDAPERRTTQGVR